MNIAAALRGINIGGVLAGVMASYVVALLIYAPAIVFLPRFRFHPLAFLVFPVAIALGMIAAGYTSASFSPGREIPASIVTGIAVAAVRIGISLSGLLLFGRYSASQVLATIVLIPTATLGGFARVKRNPPPARKCDPYDSWKKPAG